MADTIRYVYGLIGAMLVSVIIYGLFMAGQDTLYNAMNKQLGNEYLLYTGNNGQMVSNIRNAAWNDVNVDKKFSYVAYKEEE